MSETLQQFCQRILPVVQAGAEGKEIDFKLANNGAWLRKGECVFGGEFEYRIAQPKATPLPITPEMWAMIDQKYKFAVLTKGAFGSDIVIFTSDKPEFNGSVWSLVDVVELCSSPLAIDTTGIVPELSLTERPKSADEALKQAMANESRVIKKLIIDGGAEDNHDDCQLLIVSSWGAKSPFRAALDEIISNPPIK